MNRIFDYIFEAPPVVAMTADPLVGKVYDLSIVLPVLSTCSLHLYYSSRLQRFGERKSLSSNVTQTH